jgi:hypothetical protein
MSASEGRRVDQYLAVQPKPATQSVLQSLKLNFDYLECVHCGRIVETPRITETDIESWKFGLMGLRPSILGVAKAECPLCQELQKQFSAVFRPVEK